MIAFLASAEAGTAGVEGGRDVDRGPQVVAAVTGATRDLAFGAEYPGAGLSPALVRGSGLTLELAAQGLASFDPAAGTHVLPASPFLGVGAVVGREVRLGFGAHGGFIAPLGGQDTGFGAGGRLGVAVGSLAGGRWFGVEVDGGYAAIRGALFDGPETDLLWSRGGPDQPGTDTAAGVRGSVESVVSWDVDESAVVYARLGAAGTAGAFGSPTLGARWTWVGVEPRATLGAGYRPDSRTLVAVSARVGIREPDATRVYPWTVGLGLTRRVGRAELPAPVVVVEASPPAPAPVVQAPRVRVVRHPLLECPEDTLSTGTPPPEGLEGWCVLVTPDGRVVRDGPYLRWTHAEHVAEEGEYRADQRSGLWVAWAPDGTKIAEGNYADGLKDGPWKTWYPGGGIESDEQWLRGREHGSWRYYGADGSLRVAGDWLNGFRDGTWLDYAADGRPVRQRVYRDGRLMHEQLLSPP